MATRYFHWDAVDDCVMHETDDGGATTVEYTHEPGQFGPLLSETRSGTESYHHYDALGSTTALSDPTGALTDTFQYDAWGNQVARTGTTPTPYTWVGRWGYQHDTPTGGYYIRARSYQPTVAQWMSVDPIRYRKPLNVFVGFKNSPNIYTDPSGKIVVRIHGTPKRPKCPTRGGYVKFEFSMTDEPAEENGFLVQQVTVVCNIHSCADAGEEITFTYYEAWRVPRGFGRDRNDRKVDTAIVTLRRNCQIGHYRQTGVIRFYSNEDVGLNGNSTSKSIPGWTPVGTNPPVYYPERNHPCATTAGTGLTSTDDQPDFWEGDYDGTPGERMADFTWRCCPKARPCCSDGSSDTGLEYEPETN